MLNSAFQWKCHPKAEALLLSFLDSSCEANPFIERLRQDLQKHTSTRLFDWLDHLTINHTPEVEVELEQLGFAIESASPAYRIYHHPGAQLPRLVIRDEANGIAGAALMVERIADFLMARGMAGWIEGTPFSRFRRGCVSTENQTSLWVVERRGSSGIEPVYMHEGYLERYFEALEKWKTRPRNMASAAEALNRAIKLAEEMVETLGQELAAWIVLECEREYWQQRNKAAQLQYSRQQQLGMGWANHDHHTFRSSRQHFHSLSGLFEILGFHCRERFYAGEEAGWGAQVMENPKCQT